MCTTRCRPTWRKNKQFFSYRAWLIAQYMAGNKSARGTFQHEDTVSVVDETMLLQRDNGKAMLLASYEVKFGSSRMWY